MTTLRRLLAAASLPATLAISHCTPYQPPVVGRAATTGHPQPGTPPPATATPPPPQDYPVARRTSNPSRVISPYQPFNVIDVTGFRSGDLARDPTNQQIFRLP